MWFEIALALGGRTIAEWQDAMDNAEFLRWVEFRRVNGPLNPLRRADYSTANIGYIVSRVFGGKARFEDFMLFKPKESEQEATLEDIASMLGVKKRGKP